jgi:hypothetical protein
MVRSDGRPIVLCRRGALVGLAVSAATVLTACGSSHDAAPSAVGTPLQQSCAAVAAVLGNGPDVSEDPVGYAEAQILPLRTVATTDGALHRAVLALSAGYAEYFRTNGSSASKAAVRTAAAEVDAICPGATS